MRCFYTLALVWALALDGGRLFYFGRVCSSLLHLSNIHQPVRSNRSVRVTVFVDTESITFNTEIFLNFIFWHNNCDLVPSTALFLNRRVGSSMWQDTGAAL